MPVGRGRVLRADALGPSGQRLALAAAGGVVARLDRLEGVLAAARRRASAEATASTAERQAATARDRFVSFLAARPAHVAGARGWAKDLLDNDLSAALERIAVIEATIAQLRPLLAATATPGWPTRSGSHQGRCAKANETGDDTNAEHRDRPIRRLKEEAARVIPADRHRAGADGGHEHR